MEKKAALEALYARYAQCAECPLAKLGRTNIVFGTGNIESKLMFIGEGPGEQEDKQALPFVGKSGQLLTRMLSIAGIQREDVYITNIVKCRPPGNRKPLPIESTTCKKILLYKQIEIIKPQIICTLGACATEALIENSLSISKTRGTIVIWQGIKIIPTFHPAYILRTPTALEKTISDFLHIKKELHSL